MNNILINNDKTPKLLYTFYYILIFFSFSNFLIANEKQCYFTKTNIKDTLNYFAVEIFIDAKTLELQGDYTSAITLYKKALEFDDSPGIHFAISIAYYKIGKFKEALTEINKAIISGGDKTDYLILKANIYLQLNDISTATKILKIF